MISKGTKGDFMLKNKKVESLIYVVLIVSAIFLALSILTILFGLIIRIFTDLKLGDVLMIIHRTFFIAFFVFGILFLILSFFFETFNKIINLSPIKLSKKGNKSLKHDLIFSLIDDKYEDCGIIPNDFNCEINCFFKETISYRYIYIILDCSSADLEQKIIDNYLDFCLRELKISKVEMKNVAITTVLLAKSNNKIFQKACDRLVVQGEHNFRLPVYVDCKNGVIYFSAQGNEMWENIYRRLYNTF